MSDIDSVPPTSGLHALEIDRRVCSGDRVPDVSGNAIKQAVIYDEQGNSFHFHTLYQQRKCIIVFIRNFLCFTAVDYVRDIARVPADNLKKCGVGLAVIGCGPWRAIKDFRKVTGYKYELYCDPQRYLYSNLHLTTSQNKIIDNIHLRTPLLLGMIQSTWRAMKSMEYQGDIKQNGGAFVVGPGDTVHLSHVDGSSTDVCEVNDLLLCAGCETVQFYAPPASDRGRVTHL